MTGDSSHLRTFECRNALWEIFERLAREEGRPIHDLVNEAMEAYCEPRRRLAVPTSAMPVGASETPMPAAVATPIPAPPITPVNPRIETPLPSSLVVPTAMSTPFPDTGPATARTGPPEMDRMTPAPPYAPASPSPSPGGTERPAKPTSIGLRPAPPPRPKSSAPPPPRRASAPPPLPAQAITAPPATPSAPGEPYIAPPPETRAGPPPMPPPMPAGPPPMPAGPPPMAAAASPSAHPTRPPPASPSARPPNPSGPGRAAVALGNESSPARRALFVMYEGKRIEVSKDRFVIGRGSRSTDLTIKDSAVSRQHAMVEWVDHGPDAGRYFLVDLGSTNGVVYRGERFDRREIQEGDRYEISGHWIVFTYQ